MIIKQKKLDETWGLFINSNYANNISNVDKDKYIQLRDKLQKEINEKGYADTDDPKLTEWWMKLKKNETKECYDDDIFEDPLFDDEGCPRG